MNWVASTVNGEELFWDLVERLFADPAVRRSTMMGLPCVRLDGRFFASLDRRTGALLVEAQTHARGTGTPEPDRQPNTTRFVGFGEAGLTFLAGLERDNSKQFFRRTSRHLST